MQIPKSVLLNKTLEKRTKTHTSSRTSKQGAGAATKSSGEKDNVLGIEEGNVERDGRQATAHRGVDRHQLRVVAK
jgi:hypothetical protein